MTLSVSYQTRPRPGEIANGDGALVRDHLGRTLLAVIDGLGHGPSAAEASTAALDYLRYAPLDVPILELIQGVHTRLRGTRGAAGTLCVIYGGSIEACAVGNVQLSCLNASVPLVLSPGILGHRVQKFKVCTGKLGRKARLALMSDGIARLSLTDFAHLSAAEACKAIIAQKCHVTDDATILIADTHD